MLRPGLGGIIRHHSGMANGGSGQAHRRSSGQVMLVTVMALSGTILGATTIAGLLMLHQIRQSTDTVNSSKAIYAADSGIEYELYRFFKDDSYEDINPLSNGATFETRVVEKLADDGVTVESITIKSTGKSNKIARAFETVLSKSSE